MAINYDLGKIGPAAGLLSGLLAIILLTFTGEVRAQVSGYGRSSAPISGGAGSSAQPANPFSGMTGTFAPTHKTPDGRACISVHAQTHAQIANPKIIDQMVLVNNDCGQSIRVQICYAGSSDCIIVPLAGYEKLKRTLGIGSGLTSFRYEYRELY